MTAKERLLSTLFENDQRRHIDIKFCRGSSGDISPESLCEAAFIGLMLVDSGLAEVRDSFGDSNSPTVDVAE